MISISDYTENIIIEEKPMKYNKTNNEIVLWLSVQVNYQFWYYDNI